jgi:nicotinamide-nucleotide amidase
MKAEIISIGTELLLGEITDTNASFLAGQLPPLGVDLYWVTQVGDNRARLLEALQRAWGRSDLILTTGGLGPTDDDITREAIAEMLGEEIEVDPSLEQEIRKLFAQYQVEMTPSNIKQATIIPSAKAITNPQGSAPGWWVEKEGRIIISLPGPPRELQRMWEMGVVPRLGQISSSVIILSRTIKTFGLPEATVNEKVAHLLSSPNPTLAIYAKPDSIQLRVCAKARGREEAERMLAEGESNVREILEDYIWGSDDDTLEAIVGNLLASQGLSLAAMESSTGGLLATTLTDIPGSSRYFKGGLVAYSSKMMLAFGVDAELIARHGAVSPEVAEAMARIARGRLEADIGVGITGVPGPDEVEGKPAGTVHIGIQGGKSSRLFSGHYPGDRLQVKRRAITAALFELKKMLNVYSVL